MAIYNIDGNKLDASEINILAIGNSYSRDALSYVPKILEELIPNISVKIGILYKGSCTLAQHYSNISNDSAYEAYDFYDTETGAWTITSSVKFSAVITAKEWDIITLQQQSRASSNYSTYQPYLNDIVDLIYSNVGNAVRIGWILTPAYPTGYSGLNTGETSDDMYNSIVGAVESVMNYTIADVVFPCGTSVQNARTTSLDSLGDFGHLSQDGLHLQEGIPCLLEAYVFSLKLLEIMGKEYKGILGSEFRPTQDVITALNVPQQNGTSVGVTDANCLIAQKCAIMANKMPYVITDCSGI